MSWKRLGGKVAIETRSGVKPLRRMYELNGKAFPCLAISLWINEDAVQIEVSRKDGEKEWWCNAPLPLELIGELQEMLKEITPGSAV
jgi:hypothetical protein